jgi:hypothetical protein
MDSIHASSMAITSWLRVMDGMRRMPLFNPVIAFFDESGKFSPIEDILCMGGCVMAPEMVPPITEAWADLLVKHKLPFTSMKEAISFRGPYHGWKDEPERRNVALRDFAELLIKFGVGCMAATTPNDRFVALSDEDKKRFWNSTYYPAFEACIVGCLGHAGTELRMFCDLAEEYSERCVKLFNLVRKKHPEGKTRCVGISFCDDEVTPCLQMADMIAYCGRAVESLQCSTDPIVSELAKMLYSSDRKIGKVVFQSSSDGLGDAKLAWEEASTAE